MLASTTDKIFGYEITEHLGIVRGFSMRGFATILSSFTDPSRLKTMCDEVRECERAAFDEMLERAKAKGAHAIIGLNMSPSSFEYDNALKYQATVFGTAVKLNPPPPEEVDETNGAESL